VEDVGGVDPGLGGDEFGAVARELEEGIEAGADLR
jgi:hypothetical protein